MWVHFEDPAGNCLFCGAIHRHVCPLVRRVEFYETGIVKAVEFHTPEPQPTLQFKDMLFAKSQEGAPE